jgi:hypothetical protein
MPILFPQFDDSVIEPHLEELRLFQRFPPTKFKGVSGKWLSLINSGVKRGDYLASSGEHIVRETAFKDLPPQERQEYALAAPRHQPPALVSRGRTYIKIDDQRYQGRAHNSDHLLDEVRPLAELLLMMAPPEKQAYLAGSTTHPA